MLRAFNLNKQYRKGMGIESISFDLKMGTCLGILGPTGAGKSTLSKIFSKSITPDSGQMFFDDGNVFIQLSDKKFSQVVQVMHQDVTNSLNLRVRVKDVIEDVAFARKLSRASVLSSALDMSRKFRLPKNIFERNIFSLSGGQKQSVLLMRSLLFEPVFLFLDEPFASMDEQKVLAAYEIIEDCMREKNMGFLLVSHRLADLQRLSDRLLLLKDGRPLGRIQKKVNVFEQSRPLYGDIPEKLERVRQTCGAITDLLLE